MQAEAAKAVATMGRIAPLAQYWETIQDGVLTVVIVGELDMSNTAELEDRINSVASICPSCPLQVDITGVRFIDSWSIRALVRLKQEAVTRDSTLRVRGANSLIRRAFESAGVFDWLTAGTPASRGQPTDQASRP